MDKIYQDWITRANIDEICLKLATLYNYIKFEAHLSGKELPDEAINLRDIVLDLTELFPDKVLCIDKELKVLLR